MTRLILMTLLTLCLAWPARADWFTQGETLVYDVRMGVVKAGRAELHYQVTPAQDYTITIRAWTNDTMDSLFKMRDRLIAAGQHTPLGSFLTLTYNTALHEGDYRARRQAVFLRDKGQVVFRNLREQPVVDQHFPLLGETRDIVSAMYELRRRVPSIRVGQVYSLEVHDLRKAYTMHIEVVEKTKLKNRLGEFPVYKLKVKFVGGEADEVSDNVTLWVTDDANRWPVRINRKMAVGSFTADLRAVGGPDLNVAAPPELPRDGPLNMPEEF